MMEIMMLKRRADTMKRIRSTTLGVTGFCRTLQFLSGAIALALAPSAFAAVTPPPPNIPFPSDVHTFATSGPGFVNPGVIVGFNPQPDPPGDRTFVNLGDPTHPSININGAGEFTIVLGLQDTRHDRFSFQGVPGAPTGDARAAQFTFFTAPLADGSVFKIRFDIAGFTPGSWVSFNPQPDPPGDFVGFEFAGDAQLTWSIDAGSLDPNGNFAPLGTLSETEVPEPTTLALFGLGLAGLGVIRRRAPADCRNPLGR